MRTKPIYKAIFATLLSLTFSGCEDIEPPITELEVSRVFSPVDLTAVIRNRTTVELNWDTRSDADHYVVEFSEDSLEFNTIIRTVTVSPNELPLKETFFGDTRYSARVKGVSAAGVDDSKWSAITIRTDSENIFLPLENEDIGSVEVTLTWLAGSEVTHFVIYPGAVQRPISAGEKAAGIATITGLADYTNHAVVLYSGNSQRGNVTFKTLVDPEGANTTAVHPEDDLNAVVTAAAAGQRLVLYPGDYTAYTGLIVINKSITLIGYLPYEKPKLHVQFNFEGGAGNVAIADIEMTGDGTLANVFEYKTAGVDYGSLALSGCNIHDFTSRLIYGNVASKVTTFSIDNCVMTDIDVANSGDFIDFRPTYIANINITNSTFDNCAPGRDFVRLDAAATYTGTGLTSTVLIDHSTFYGVSNTQDRILYVRFNANTLTVQNSLFAATDGYYTNQPTSSQPTCSSNNYFNAVGFYTPAYVVNAKTDISGTHTTLDPGFANAASGDFTVSNQALKDKGVGDPRWLQ